MVRKRFVISSEILFSKELRQKTNERKGAFVWRSEPTRGASNEGMPDLTLAFNGMIYHIELKVVASFMRPLYGQVSWLRLRPTQLRFMKQLNDAGVYGYLGVGYIGTSYWDFLAVSTSDGIHLEGQGEERKMAGSFDLCEAIPSNV